MVSRDINDLVNYGINCGLVLPEDKIYVRNNLISILKYEDYDESIPESNEKRDLEEILKSLLDYAVSNGIIEEGIASRDLYDTKLMGALVMPPSVIRSNFYRDYKESPKKATDNYYKLSCDSDYIRRYRVCKDKKWTTDTKYGKLDITINLSKPEKDPKTIAAAANSKDKKYPKCLLCPENEGYMGTLSHPARCNHRIIPISIAREEWAFQYSPYVYYNEHCIVLNQKHVPMVIDENTFVKLFDFVKQFPHYFVGSNADLPIVGGSILSHEHFQGGCYEFPMERAEIKTKVTFKGYEDVNAGIVNWPMSVIRINHPDEKRLIELASKILTTWRAYTDEENFIYAFTDGIPHNTITPIARTRGENFELDLVLRNNITTKEHPLGLYHPHEELHHIKKENIGLIEVMGLAVLPARLNKELDILADYLVNNKDVMANKDICKHGAWVNELRDKYKLFDKDSIEKILQNEVGLVFEKVLENAGVLCAEGMLKFISTV